MRWDTITVTPHMAAMLKAAANSADNIYEDNFVH
jgi:hypothetical protein